MKTTSFLAVLTLTTTLASCDYVSNPIAPSGGSNHGGETVKRRALLEEFTGHHCSTCPAAHTVAAQLAGLYEEELIIVSLHAISNFNSSFIAPQNNPDGSYAADFRTTEGQDYANAFGVAGFIPQGMVNRTQYDASITLDKANWGSAAAKIISQDALCDVWVSQLTHDPTGNSVTAEVKVAALATISGQHNITVYLTEDHVVNWQYNADVNPSDVPNYDHRHVFRKTLDGTWGRSAVTASASVGDTLTFTYSNVPMDPSWNADNCALVAYVYNTTTNAVLQAAERKFIP